MLRRLVVLVLAAALAVAASRQPAVEAQASPPITVNVGANRRAIDPRIYGVNFASTAQLQALNVPLNRWGGNNTSRYNWQANADNRGADWYFESVPYGSATPGAEFDSFVSTTKAGGAEPMATIPILGWVGKLGANRSKLASFSIAKYGAQTGNDSQWFPDAGNGVSAATGQAITGNDPSDASVLKDSTFQQQWVQHLVGQWGNATSGGVRYYILDNEHSIWYATHRDVRPTGPRMQEIRDLFLDYGAKIKAADPGALIVGPEEWGWLAYFQSGYDSQFGGNQDRTLNGGWDYLPWLLNQLRQHELSTGQRVLDVFTVHYYPQGGEFGDNTTTAMQQRRNRSTRSLWDPNYVDETWISDKVRLVPRLKGWVSSYYPGLPTGITEYSWGAEGHINGATAQADVLGIFGREGLDLATRWVVPATGSVTFKAFQMYRNYDGNRSTFGDISVSVTSGLNPDDTAVFAAQRSSDGALTVMVVNKVLSGATTASVSLAGFTPGGPAQVYELTAANAITRRADLNMSGASLPISVPAQSITLFVVPSASGPTVSVNDVTVTEGNSGSTNATFTVSLSKVSGGAVTVNYATANGTATAGSDYTPATATLTFSPGETTKAVTVAVAGDTAVEPDETFYLVLSNPTGATIADGQGTGTIANDDVASSGLPVVWVNAAGVTVSGNSLTKTAAAGWGNAGAASSQSLAAGDGGAVQVTPTATTGYRMFGLSRGSVTSAYQEIDFALYLKAGTLLVYENGVSRGAVGTYAVGDTLRVAVQSGVVRYLRNGAVLYTSSAAANYPLLVDTALYHPGAALSDALLYGPWASLAPASSPVAWSSAIGVSVSGSSLAKTAVTGWGNAGAISSLSLASGEGAVEITASETTHYRMFGLGNGSTTNNYKEIDYTFYLMTGGSLRIYENGVYRGVFGSYATGDKLRVAVQSGVVRYLRNGVLLHESKVAPVYPLLVDTALYDKGGTLGDARLAGGWQ